VDYAEVQNTGSKCLYSDRSREIGVPRTLEIAHTNVGTNDAKRLRSLIKLSNTKENPSVEGDTVEQKVHIVIDTPLRIVEKADVDDLIDQLISFITSANFVDKVMNSEV
jgi:hypothetical protein